VPSNNLIGLIPEFFLDELMAKVSKLRRDPVKYLLSFDKNHFFTHSSINTTLQTFLKPVLDDCKHFHNKPIQCYTVQYQSLLQMCPVFLQECNFPTAYAISQAACSIGRNLYKVAEAIEFMEHFLLKLEDPKKAVLGFEYIKGITSDIPGSFLGNLACMYTSLYSSEPDGPTKEEYRKKADNNFQLSLNQQELRGAIGVDYSIYLRKCGKSQEAIPLLLRVLSHERETKCCNMYGASEVSSMDSHLQAEITSCDKVSAPSLFFAFYQLAHCYIETEQRDIALELMPDFSAACQQYTGQNHAFIYSLLGYTYQDLEEYQSAQDAFSKAEQIKPDYELATNNHVLCQAMMLSLESE
jgi:tetratricopeptide (TPR) repeat protein